MEQVLYRKYRPKSFDQVIGQDHITTTLKHALKSGKLAHAYLFTGPKGVGKTSVARILAYAANNLNYEDDRLHLDIIEIDAASNRRIDEIRDLRDKVRVAPTSAKYKVYIIDEVHMLTKEAFNALLKTLEEPPAHVIFILATTEAYKLPETIISRTQRFAFKPVEAAKIVNHLADVAKKEKINVDKSALELIAEHSDGSFRDSISLLDQLRHQDKTISLENVQDALGLASQQSIKNLIDEISSGNPADLVSILTGLYEQGYQASNIAKQLAEYLKRSLLSDSSAMDEGQIIELLRKLLDVPGSISPESMLEVVLLGVLFSTHAPDTKSNEVKEVKAVIPEIVRSAANEQVGSKEPSSSALKQARPAKTIELNEQLWNEILASIKQTNNALYSVLRIAKPEFQKDRIELYFPFKFHIQRINESKNQKLISDMIYNLTGKSLQVEAILSEKDFSVPDTMPKVGNQENLESNANIETINNIFGNTEMLES